MDDTGSSKAPISRYTKRSIRWCKQIFYASSGFLRIVDRNVSRKRIIITRCVYICSRTNMTRAFRPPQQKSSLSFTVVPSENNLKHFLRITKIITFSHGVCSLVVSVLDYRFKGREFKTQTRRIFFLLFFPIWSL